MSLSFITYFLKIPHVTFIFYLTVFTSCGDGVVRAFDAKGGALKRTFLGHQFAINCMQVTDGRLLTGSHDGDIRVWDISDILAQNNNTALPVDKVKVSMKKKFIITER